MTVALSIRQPWAWLILKGHKTIENRRWNTKRRGEFLIHASKGMTYPEYRDALTWCHRVGDPNAATGMPHADLLERGGIVGKARIVKVLEPCLLACDVDDDVHCRCGHPWHMGDQFGFVLEGIEPLPFTPLRGALGFFTVPT